jgi:hypothetical protein
MLYLVYKSTNNTPDGVLISWGHTAAEAKSRAEGTARWSSNDRFWIHQIYAS